MRFDYLIVGGGMVADQAARGIRELDETGTIGILSADVDPPYTRPALTKKLWTDPDFTWDQVPLDTVEQTGAHLELETLVTAVDREAREVEASDGSRVGYERLLLATGSRPREFEAPDDERILFFRSADDYLTLRDLVDSGTRVVVVGGGYIGAELAAGLVQNDAEVVLVHPDAVLGASMFPGGIARRYERMFREGGVHLIPDRRVDRVDDDEEGLCVRLDDRSSLAAEVVVAGLGVAPVVDIARDAGLPVEDGVVVDERLRTADEHIWAAGDIASYPDPILGRTRSEHVDNANEMGRAVGRSMAGDAAPFRHTPFVYSEVFGTRWEAVGRLDGSLETVIDELDDDRAVVYYLDGDDVVGVLLWKVQDATDAARAVLAEQPPRDALRGRIR